MKDLGSKTLETERLILRKTEEKDLKRLWEILWIEDVNKYYLTSKINKDWEEEKKWQYKKLEKASDPDVYCWTITTKDNTVIGQITVQEMKEKKENYRDIGWFLDPKYQHLGYAYEAANKILNYMFQETGLEGIITSAAIINKPSWNLMEKLGFKRLQTTHKEKYTFIEEPIEVYEYQCLKTDFLKGKEE